MIERIIGASARNLMLVLIGTAFVVVAGIYAVLHTPLDALPDLSDTQSLIFEPLEQSAVQALIWPVMSPPGEDKLIYLLTEISL